MGVYIKDMEMPESGTYEVSIDNTKGKDKTVMSLFVRGEGGLICCGVYEVVPVPPHGRLIDADALIRELEITEEDDRNGATLLMAVFLEVLKSAPTIIPAEPAEEGE